MNELVTAIVAFGIGGYVGYLVGTEQALSWVNKNYRRMYGIERD